MATIYSDGVFSYLGQKKLGTLPSSFYSSTTSGDIHDLLQTRVRYGITKAETGNELCLSWSAMLNTGGEIFTNAPSSSGSSPVNCNGSIDPNARFSVMLFTDQTSRKVASINSSSTSGQSYTVDGSSTVDISMTYAIFNSGLTRIRATLFQGKFLTIFVYKDKDNYYTIQQGYTDGLGLNSDFPLYCCTYYSIRYLGVDYWYGFSPATISGTTKKDLPRTGRVIYPHLTSSVSTVSVTDFYATAETGAIGMTPNAKILKNPDLSVGTLFTIDSNKNGSSNRYLMVIDRVGALDPDIVNLWRCNGAVGTLSNSNFVDETGNSSVWLTYGTASIVDTPSKFNGRSLKNNGDASIVITTPTRSIWEVGYGAFTIEAFVYMASAGGMYILSCVTNAASVGASGTNSWAWTISVASNGTPTFELYYSNFSYAGSRTGSPSTFTFNAWNHVAISSQNSYAQFFINGVPCGASWNMNYNLNNSYGGAVTYLKIADWSQSAPKYLDDIVFTRRRKYPFDTTFTPLTYTHPSPSIEYLAMHVY